MPVLHEISKSVQNCREKHVESDDKRRIIAENDVDGHSIAKHFFGNERRATTRVFRGWGATNGAPRSWCLLPDRFQWRKYLRNFSTSFFLRYFGNISLRRNIQISGRPTTYTWPKVHTGIQLLPAFFVRVPTQLIFWTTLYDWKISFPGLVLSSWIFTNLVVAFRVGANNLHQVPFWHRTNLVSIETRW